MNLSTSDRSVSAAIFLCSMGYLWFWPRELNGFDESMYLYNAKRVYQGAVMYRDVFDLNTPAWFYLMAAMYALFGFDIETARGVMAVHHALIGVFTFLTARVAGVRAILALLMAMTHLALAYPGCAIATPHWGSTLVTLILLFVLVRWPPRTPSRAVWCGIIAGVLTLIQQQKGALMVAGAAVVILVDALFEAPRPPAAVVMRRLFGYAGAVAAVTVPVLLGLIAVAGFHPVYRALIRVPLVGYRAMVAGRIPWGGYWPGIVPHGYVIKYLPLVIPVAALWLAWRWFSARGGPHLRDVTVMWICAAFAFWSVWYAPDHLHFSYVAPLLFVLAACWVEHLVRDTRGNAMVSIATLILVAGAAWQLQLTLQQWRARCQFQIRTPFGLIATENPQAGAVYGWLADLFRSAGATHVFAFPTIPGVYLFTGTENATGYQILQHFTDREQLAEVIADLERRQTLFIVRNFYVRPKDLEPLNIYLDRHYEKLAVPPSFKTTTYVGVYRRKAAAGPSPSAL